MESVECVVWFNLHLRVDVSSRSCLTGWAGAEAWPDDVFEAVKFASAMTNSVVRVRVLRDGVLPVIVRVFGFGADATGSCPVAQRT